MEISAYLKNTQTSQAVTVTTAHVAKVVPIPSNAGGSCSSVNGGELLMLALATCYCNDIYREAARLGVTVTAVEVEATAQFQGVGLGASHIKYRASVQSPASREQVTRLLQETDAVAEIHNTIRAGADVTMVPWQSQL